MLPGVNQSPATIPVGSTHNPEYLNLRLREKLTKGSTRLEIPDRPNSSWLANDELTQQSPTGAQV